MENIGQTSTNDSQVHQLTYEETREILTPFAFELDKSLFGTPLASPWKRAGALLIDLLCVAILSGAPGELLAIVIAVTAYKLGNKQKNKDIEKVKKGRKRRAFLRISGVFILFITLLSVLPALFTDESSKQGKGTAVTDEKGNITQTLNIKNTLMLTSTIAELITTIDGSNCHDVACWQDELSDQVEDFALFPFENEVILGALDEVVEATALPKVEQMELHRLLFVSYQAQKAADNANNGMLKSYELPTPKLPPFIGNSEENVEDEQPTEQTEKPAKHQYSIVKLIEGIIEDLGLGFGWAAFYFTVLTALWHGQTLGKKIFRIKVLQLDGTKLSMWDSFGRYGGYGAGIATGLLGFIQVFWDANRQAIHDKISSTVVVDVSNKLMDSHYKQQEMNTKVEGQIMHEKN